MEAAQHHNILIPISINALYCLVIICQYGINPHSKSDEWSRIVIHYPPYRERDVSQILHPARELLPRILLPDHEGRDHCIRVPRVRLTQHGRLLGNQVFMRFVF
jgi:hypothetical protein